MSHRNIDGVLDFTKAEMSACYGLASQLPASSYPEFVFSGRSNVGKSSLINKLCNRKKLARISGTPGKTATINFYGVGAAYLVDLPGYGYAKTSASERQRWDKLINGYFKSRRDIRLLVQLLDCRHAPSKDDLVMLDYIRHYQLPFIAALTKADKVKPSQHKDIEAEFSHLLEYPTCKGVVLTSAEKGTGIDSVKDLLQQSMDFSQSIQE